VGGGRPPGGKGVASAPYTLQAPEGGEVRKDLPGHRVTPRLSTSRRPQGDFIPELFPWMAPSGRRQGLPHSQGCRGPSDVLAVCHRGDGGRWRPVCEEPGGEPDLNISRRRDFHDWSPDFHDWSPDSLLPYNAICQHRPGTGTGRHWN